MLSFSVKGGILMLEHLKKLYGAKAHIVQDEIMQLMKDCHCSKDNQLLNEKDMMIITYGDSILDGKKASLKVLNDFLKDSVGDLVNTVHILPMFTYTSDDGFSVVDYLEIDPALGSWKNVTELSKNYDLMFDAVINHISKSSTWFKEYAKGNSRYEDYFIECDPSVDYSSVVRPRALPLYYEYDTVFGKKNLWATFSEDQLDINYENPKVLIDVLKVLLEYASNGARFIRLDAIGFAWKKIGTTCIHLDETHALIKTMRYVLSQCYPDVKLITETNVPHHENITYFGNGLDEAHLIYQFPLPPLTLHAFLSQNAEVLMKWADSLKETKLTKETTYFNFLASHDGIGLRPTEGILSEEDRQAMANTVLSRGGRISYKDNPDGSKSPYEMNINYLDALCESTLTIDEKVQKFIASQSILLALQGVPGIYIHSLLGSRNDIKGMEESGINRRINREKLNVHTLLNDLKDEKSLRHGVFNTYKKMLSIRKEHSAFSPLSKQVVLNYHKQVFSIKRTSKNEEIICLVNVGNESVNVNIGVKGLDLISGRNIDHEVTLSKHDVIWVKIEV